MPVFGDFDPVHRGADFASLKIREDFADMPVLPVCHIPEVDGVRRVEARAKGDRIGRARRRSRNINRRIICTVDADMVAAQPGVAGKVLHLLNRPLQLKPKSTRN